MLALKVERMLNVQEKQAKLSLVGKEVETQYAPATLLNQIEFINFDGVEIVIPAGTRIVVNMENACACTVDSDHFVIYPEEYSLDVFN